VGELVKANELLAAERIAAEHLARGGALDRSSCNVILKLYTMTEKTDEAERWMAKMKAKGGVGVDNVTYTCVGSLFVLQLRDRSIPAIESLGVVLLCSHTGWC
jgi:pentatricopeptide repeat protein